MKTFRVDRMREARKLDETFEPRPGIVPNSFENARTARVLYSKGAARRRLERGSAQPLSGGAAVEDRVFGSLDWLASEILEQRGEAVVVEPPEVRSELTERFREIAAELTAAPAGKRR